MYDFLNTFLMYAIWFVKKSILEWYNTNGIYFFITYITIYQKKKLSPKFSKDYNFKLKLYCYVYKNILKNSLKKLLISIEV